MNKDFDIAVICPTFNSEEFIENTLSSIFSQSLSVQELIISDDGSTDKTTLIVEKIFLEYKGKISCKLLKNIHKGPGAARNSGILSTKSTWLAFIDSDDLWKTNKIHEVFLAIQANPDVNFLCHNEYRIAINMKKTIINCSSRFNSSKSIVGQLYKANIISTSSVVCKRNLLLENSLFDETLMSIQDYELWLRISPYMNIMFLDKILGTYIERKGNISSTKPLQRFKNEFIVIYKNRHLVSLILFIFRFLRLSLSHTFQLFRRLY